MSAAGGTAARLPILSDADLSLVRQRVRAKAQELGFGLVQQTKLVTAASELARNTLVHGGGGEMEMTEVTQTGRHGLRLSFIDSGPGLADVEQALTDGYTTGNGLGMGLGGARRLVHEFTIDTAPQRGTTVTIVAWASTPVDSPVVRR
ncbi:anti-sigma regulatory factor [Thermobifida halotolerans]|uniref:Anti-sigma regulatory factor n=1 Tax=Thermobifida halotolerans TaxID=483545 RepID=A0A399FXD5_9ACTN|nr:anti-sigma regulatory factor [Thermobifida halotolerans]UOE19065.1 anti-sigma regulatory factor [Thermobifida halotolerans]